MKNCLQGADLTKLPNETEWVEFKESCSIPAEIGEYLSALSNSACLHSRPAGYLIFGIEDITHKAVGTKYEPRNSRQTYMGDEKKEHLSA